MCYLPILCRMHWSRFSMQRLENIFRRTGVYLHLTLSLQITHYWYDHLVGMSSRLPNDRACLTTGGTISHRRCGQSFKAIAFLHTTESFVQRLTLSWIITPSSLNNRYSLW